jgi:hypothetical protein
MFAFLKANPREIRLLLCSTFLTPALAASAFGTNSRRRIHAVAKPRGLRAIEGVPGDSHRLHTTSSRTMPGSVMVSHHIVPDQRVEAQPAVPESISVRRKQLLPARHARVHPFPLFQCVVERRFGPAPGTILPGSENLPPPASDF